MRTAGSARNVVAQALRIDLSRDCHRPCAQPPRGCGGLLPAAGDMTVPLAPTFAFEDTRDAMAMLAGPHPSAKLARMPGARCRDRLG
jgi:hypothetical protein